jgi:hypothetical protein
MKYEEMSDYEINKSVMGFVNPECVKFFPDVPSKPNASGYNKNGAWLFSADYCNHPGDWGKLMHDNKISLNWWPATEDDGVGYWGASTKVQWQNANHETKPGRAISICYLKIMENKDG